MALVCAISGESPQDPVVSRKSGNVYERNLIEAYVTENGSEPTTGEALTTDDLLSIKAARSVRPRPPTLTSIPSLLGVFQQEWDALALEVFNLQQNLEQTRQELSTALYQHDAAVRIIARLTKERDDARKALAEVSVGARTVPAAGTNGEAMQVDDAPLPSAIIAKVEETQAALMKTRRKRPVPEDWATSENISSYEPSNASESVFPGAQFLAVNKNGDAALLGSAKGMVGICSTSTGEALSTLEIGDVPITAGAWAGSNSVIGCANGQVRISQGSREIASFRTHAGMVTGMSVHPSGEILASVGVDKSYILYDVEAGAVLTQVYTTSELTCTQFHPDGHLLAVGNRSGQVEIYDVKSGGLGGTFDTGGPLSALAFSENGTWLAAAAHGSSVVSIFDLRKAGAEGLVRQIETGGPVESLDWDYTAQFLLTAGPGGITVQQYTKGTKQWSEPLKVATPAGAIAWGAKAQSILAVDKSGVLTILS